MLKQVAYYEKRNGVAVGRTAHAHRRTAQTQNQLNKEEKVSLE